MTKLTVLLLLLLAAPEKDALFGRIREKLLAAIDRLPNYTCKETVDRYRGQTRGKKPQLMDRVRLEIAVVGGSELFGWPGSGKITEADVTRMVPGFIGSGDFAMHVRELFSRRETVFTRAGSELRRGRELLRYNYSVPVDASGWRLRGAGRELLPVAYHGSFWVASESGDLVELTIIADSVPPELGFKRLSKTLEFDRARIGESSFLLPATVRMSAVDLTGDEWLNEIRFHDCRQYAVESVVRYDAPAEGDPVAASARQDVAAATLPDDFDLTTVLETPIDSDTSAVGDLIRARVENSVKARGVAVVPKGAMLTLRIVQLTAASGSRILGLAPAYIEASGFRVELGGRRNNVELERREPLSRQPGEQPLFYRAPLPLVVRGSRLRLPAGSKLFVRSRADAAR